MLPRIFDTNVVPRLHSVSGTRHVPGLGLQRVLGSAVARLEHERERGVAGTGAPGLVVHGEGVQTPMSTPQANGAGGNTRRPLASKLRSVLRFVASQVERAVQEGIRPAP